MTDTVFIRGLKAVSVIGCYDWERDIRQTLVIDLELKANFTRAAQSDALEDALDYAAISQRVIAVCDASRFQLLEALAEHWQLCVGGVFDRTFADDVTARRSAPMGSVW